MTKNEALRLALEALEEIGLKWPNVLKAIDAIKEALKTKDEPVAWGMEKDGVIIDVICPAEHEREEGEYTIPLYTTPQRTWLGLTDEEIDKIRNTPMSVEGGVGFSIYSYARTIEAKLKEKNT